MVIARYVGRPIGHVEGPDKVSGHARYAGDIALPGMLWGKCLRSPLSSARIISIDTSRAAALPGVHAVVTGADSPDCLIGRGIRDMHPLATERVRFIGEKIAAVAADSPEIAEEAVLLIDVEYEELPAVLDPFAAMEDGAPHVHDDLRSYPGASAAIPSIPNVVSQVFFRQGDVEAGFAEADRIFEHTFQTASVHQGYIEPTACIVRIDADGKINCWLSNKSPFQARRQLAAALVVPEDRIRVHLVPVGGDFGGKGSLMDAVVCYYLAERAQRPVKMVMTYAEELMAGNPRHASTITMRTGVTRDGRLTARRATVIFDAGAYAGFVPSPTANLHGAVYAAGPYKLPNVEIEALRVYTNTVPCGHMRSPGAPQAAFAEECHMDMIAHELGLDPFEFRLRNCLVDGDAAPLGERWQDIRSTETLQAAAREAGWGNQRAPNVGLGIGLHERAPGGGPSNSKLIIDENGGITLLTGVADTGTGSHTILQQIVAEELRVSLGSVTVQAGNTDTAALDLIGPGGSRITHAAGQATRAAAVGLATTLVTFAARVWHCSPEQVRFHDAAFTCDDGRVLRLADLMACVRDLGEAPIVETGSFQSSPADVTSFVVQIAEVEVDPETGQVKLRRIVSAHDVGTVINPLTHQGQIDGGVAHGIGQALTEQLILEDGAVTNPNLGDYKLPTMADMPDLTTVLLETKHGPAPYEGKAIGELTNVAIPAAIANAIFDAVGVRITELPITAEKVYTALRERDSR